MLREEGLEHGAGVAARGVVREEAAIAQVPAAHRLNTNENPHPLPPALLADLGEALARVAVTLNRYPDREFVAFTTPPYDDSELLPPTSRQLWSSYVPEPGVMSP